MPAASDKHNPSARFGSCRESPVRLVTSSPLLLWGRVRPRDAEGAMPDLAEPRLNGKPAAGSLQPSPDYPTRRLWGTFLQFAGSLEWFCGFLIPPEAPVSLHQPRPL